MCLSGKVNLELPSETSIHAIEDSSSERLEIFSQAFYARRRLLHNSSRHKVFQHKAVQNQVESPSKVSSQPGRSCMFLAWIR